MREARATLAEPPCGASAGDSHNTGASVGTAGRLGAAGISLCREHVPEPRTEAWAVSVPGVRQSLPSFTSESAAGCLLCKEQAQLCAHLDLQWRLPLCAGSRYARS